MEEDTRLSEGDLALTPPLALLPCVAWVVVVTNQRNDRGLLYVVFRNLIIGKGRYAPEPEAGCVSTFP